MTPSKRTSGKTPISKKPASQEVELSLDNGSAQVIAPDKTDRNPQAIPNRSARCPECKQPLTATSAKETFPFCSARCKSLDLGAWASEKYRVATIHGSDSDEFNNSDIHTGSEKRFDPDDGDESLLGELPSGKVH